MIKKLTITMIITCLLIAPFFSFIQFSQAQNSPTLSLTPQTVTVTNPSETFELAFKINDVKNLWGWKAVVTWDPQYLEMTKNPRKGGFYPEDTSIFTYTINKVPAGFQGPIDANGIATGNEAMLELDAPSGSGTLVIFTFKVLKPVISTTITVNATELLAPTGLGTGVHDPINPYPAVTYATATVSYIPSDGSPVAHAGSNQTINQFTNVTLDASQTIPQDIADQTYTWTFTDNATRTLTGKTVNYTFDHPGEIPVTLTVTNSKGTSTAIIYIIVKSTTPPVPVIRVTAVDAVIDDSGEIINVSIGQQLRFNSEKSYDPYNLTLGIYTWNFGDGNTINQRDPGHSYSTSGTYIVSLTIPNSAGISGTATKTIVVGDGAPNSSPGSNKANDSSNGVSRESQQNTLDLPQVILYPLIFVTVFAIGGAAFWLRKKTDNT
jgi:PKD repeat protein